MSDELARAAEDWRGYADEMRKAEKEGRVVWNGDNWVPVAFFCEPDESAGMKDEG